MAIEAINLCLMTIALGQIVKFFRVRFKIEQHWAETAFGMHQLIAAIKHHKKARVSRLQPQLHGLRRGRVIIFTYCILAPLGPFAL